MSTGEGDDDNIGGDDTKKSERKRQRERQRRYDLANAFDELASLLAQIDPEDSDSGAKRRRRKSDVAVEADADNNGMTRLDLIGRSVEALRRLHRENTDLKRIVEQQREGREDKEVLVMVPTLTSVDGGDHGPMHGGGPRPPPYPPPYYPQQQHHQQPPPLSPQHGPPDYNNRGPPQPPPGNYYYPPGPTPNPYHYAPNWAGSGPQSHMQQQQLPPGHQYPPPHQQQQQQRQSPGHYDTGSPQGPHSHPPPNRDLR